MFQRDLQRKRGANIIIVLLYLILGVYFVNFPLGFLQIPESISKFDPWIIFAGGILLFLGVINYFRVKRVQNLF